MKHWLLLVLLLGLPAWGQAQSFAPAAFYSTLAGTQPFGLDVGDVNGDGYPDIVASSSGGNYANAVLLNQQNGTFAPVLFYSTGNFGAMSAALADVNGDGYRDIITGNSTDKTVCILLNQQNGTFGGPTNYPTGTSSYPTAVAVSDVNRDGHVDILVANASAGAAGVLLNLGNGTFAPLVSYVVGANTSPASITTGDVNKDGYPDLVVGVYNAGNVGSLGVLLNQGNGTFAPVVLYAMGANSVPYGVSVGDVNGDTYPDIVTANDLSGNVQVLLNQQNGTFAASAMYPSGVNVYTERVALGDINGDGRLDIVTANNSTNSVGVLLNQQNNSFATAVTYPLGSVVPRGLVLSDVNRDGRLDIILSGPSANGVSVLLNTGTFVPLSSSSRQPLASSSLQPNPARATTTIWLPAVAGAGHAQLSLCDALGRPVRALAVPLPAAGLAQPLDLSGLAPGMYLLRVQAEEAQITRRLLVE